MLTVKTCCFIYTLKRGCYFIGIFCIIKSIVKICLGILFAYLEFDNAKKADGDDAYKLNTTMAVVSIVVTLFSVIEIISNMFLILGIQSNKHKMIFPWMVLCVVDLIISASLFVAAIVLIAMPRASNEYIWTLFAEPLNVCINIYFHLVVHSYYKQLKSIAPSIPEMPSPVPPTAQSEKLDTSPLSTPLTQYLIQVPTLPPIQQFKKHHPRLEDGIGDDPFGSTISYIHDI